MYHAATHADVERLQKLLRDGLQGVNEPIINGSTALHAAAETNNRNCLRLLLDAKADAERKRSTDGASIVYIACQGNACASLKLLLDMRADHNITRAMDGAGPIHAAAETNATG